MAKKGIPPTVCNFYTVLTAKLTQYDVRDQRARLKRGWPDNIHQLGLLLQAAQKVEGDLKRVAPDCNVNMTPEIASVMRTSLRRNFNPGFSPATNVEKQLDAFLTTGKQPTLLGARRGRRR